MRSNQLSYASMWSGFDYTILNPKVKPFGKLFGNFPPHVILSERQRVEGSSHPSASAGMLPVSVSSRTQAVVVTPLGSLGIVLADRIDTFFHRTTPGIPKGEAAETLVVDNLVRFLLGPPEESEEHAEVPRRLFAYFLVGEKVGPRRDGTILLPRFFDSVSLRSVGMTQKSAVNEYFPWGR